MRLKLSLFLMASMLALSACNSADTLEIVNVTNKVEQPLPPRIQSQMRVMGMTAASPIAMRIFKEEGILEVWKANAQNRYQLIASYDICAWSGQLGPKLTEGDRQAPEGFYNIYPSQMNPQSQYYLSFNIGFPNKYDRAHGARGNNLMVHGACSSAGCYSMTDAQVLQIYAFAREAFRGGQEYFQVQAYPFKMTADNMAKHRFSRHYEFWKMIKVGYDHFELTKRPPVVDVCDGKYVFNQVAAANAKFDAKGACPVSSTPPALVSAYSSYEKSFQTAFASATRKWDANDFVEPSELERKSTLKTRSGAQIGSRKSKTRMIVIDPKAKVTPTSDAIAVASLKPGQKIELGTILTNKGGIVVKPMIRSATDPKPVMPSPSSINATTSTTIGVKAKTANAVVPEAAKINGKAVPVPSANPLKPLETATEQKKKPFWKVW